MSDERIHGVHYLVDYYAFFQIPRDADVDIIRKAWRRLLSQYHPDNLSSKAAPDLRAEAERMSRVISEAKETLLDPAKRAAYDSLLDSWEGPISDSGDPVVWLNRPYWSVNPYFGKDLEQIEKSLSATLEAANAMVGYIPSVHEFLEQQLGLASQPSPGLEQAMRESLASLDRRLAIEESFRKEVMGLDTSIGNNPPRAYLEAVAEEVEAGREQIGTEAQRTLQAIKSGELKMLGPGADQLLQEAASDPEKALVRISEEVTARFEAQAEEVLKLAERRQEVIEKRLDLLRPKYLPEQTVFYPRFVVHLSGSEGNEVWMAFTATTGPDGINVTGDESLDRSGLARLADAAAAVEWIRQGSNLLHIEWEEDLPILASVEAAISWHMRHVDENIIPPAPLK